LFSAVKTGVSHSSKLFLLPSNLESSRNIKPKLYIALAPAIYSFTVSVKKTLSFIPTALVKCNWNT
jgi:hypothetical protein